MKFGLIISNTQRSKVYFTELLKNNLKPKLIILLINKKNQNINFNLNKKLKVKLALDLKEDKHNELIDLFKFEFSRNVRESVAG